MADLIDREALIAEYEYLKAECYESSADAWEDIIDRVKKQPTVDAEPIRHAHWIFKNNLASELVCSSCFEQFHIATWQCPKFLRCPCCGAKMDKEVEE